MSIADGRHKIDGKAKHNQPGEITTAHKVGMESVIQMLRMIMKIEQIRHRNVPLPIFSWARSIHAAMPGIAPSDSNNSQPGRWPLEGFAGDAPI